MRIKRFRRRKKSKGERFLRVRTYIHKKLECISNEIAVALVNKLVIFSLLMIHWWEPERKLSFSALFYAIPKTNKHLTNSLSFHRSTRNRPNCIWGAGGWREVALCAFCLNFAIAICIYKHSYTCPSSYIDHILCQPQPHMFTIKIPLNSLSLFCVSVLLQTFSNLPMRKLL